MVGSMYPIWLRPTLPKPSGWKDVLMNSNEKNSKPLHPKRRLHVSGTVAPPEISGLSMNNIDVNHQRSFAAYAIHRPKGDMLVKPPNAKTTSTYAPKIVLLQPQPPHHFSFVKGDKWFGGKFYNRNYLGKGIRRVEKEFLVV
jgi:hypothetical protein